jgi:hypothetical protein
MLSGRPARVNGANTTFAVGFTRIVAELGRRPVGMFPICHAAAAQLHNPPITLTWLYPTIIAIGYDAHQRDVNESIL